MPGARIANNNVAGCLAGILGLAVNSQMDGLRIEGNTVRGAGLSGTLDLVAAVAPGLLPPAVVALDLPDWGALGIGLVGIGGGTSVDDFVINDNRLDRHVAGILVAGIGGASMQNGTIADNYSSQHLLGIVALSLGANLGGLDIEDNTLTGFGPDILILP